MISNKRIQRIKAQGYFKCSDQEISDLSFGNRFAYILCTSILIIGVATANIPILIAMGSIAFLGVVLPNHPFDYIYNYWLRYSLHKPKLPTRSIQLKFACSMATAFIATTIYLFSSGYMTAGYVVGSLLIVVATLVSSIDFCIPSIIYNSVILKKKN
jgi:hypothetical protein